mmetsp:Transcript_10058/g.27537  ORF Transcript_10058/g.27537 Transcript_10058/m.27537 type:complete len:217 (-) Transcript_10058:554-1204(-)
MPLLERGWDAFSRVVQKHTSGLLGEYVSWQAAKGPSFNTRGYVWSAQFCLFVLLSKATMHINSSTRVTCNSALQPGAQAVWPSCGPSVFRLFAPALSCAAGKSDSNCPFNLSMGSHAKSLRVVSVRSTSAFTLSWTSSTDRSASRETQTAFFCCSNISATFSWKSAVSYRSPPKPPRALAASADTSRYSTRSGAGKVWSGALHHSKLIVSFPLAEL